MKLNCKPGDLAVIVKAKYDPVQLGKIVTVIGWDSFAGGWNVDPPVVTDGVKWRAVSDRALRQIRDQPGEDETLTWAGFPTTHKEDGMTDEQLTALAAKLVGAEPHGVTTEWCIKHADGIWRDFQPLTDDGDALRLAVKLGIQIHFEGDGCSSAVWANEVMLWIDGGDTEAATRLAITRAAAEIQLQKEREQ